MFIFNRFCYTIKIPSSIQSRTTIIPAAKLVDRKWLAFIRLLGSRVLNCIKYFLEENIISYSFFFDNAFSKEKQEMLQKL